MAQADTTPRFLLEQPRFLFLCPQPPQAPTPPKEGEQWRLRGPGAMLNKEARWGHALPAACPPPSPGVVRGPGGAAGVGGTPLFPPLFGGPVNHFPALQYRPLVALHVVEKGDEEPRDHQHLGGRKELSPPEPPPRCRVGVWAPLPSPDAPATPTSPQGTAPTFKPIRLRWSCSGSAAHRRNVQTSLAICDMVAGVPGEEQGGD